MSSYVAARVVEFLYLNHFELNTTEAIINATAANLGLACLSRLAATWILKSLSGRA